MKFWQAIVLWILLLVASVWAGDPASCGSHCCGHATKKVCRLVCEPKQEKCVQYDVVKEDFCIPGPSKLRGKACVPDPCNPCEKILRKIWQPTCAKVHTRKVLVKKEVEYEVPSYKWVVEEVCCRCGGCRHVCSVDIDEAQAAQPLPLPETVIAAAAELEADEE